jgi:hypothetical protein
MAMALLLLQQGYLRAQTGSGTSKSEKHAAYFDSIKNSDYKWALPIWGKKISKKGFDIPYPVGIMVNTLIAQQEVEITELKVGVNDREQVPLDFIKFGKVTANVKTVVVRPDVWVLPFLDIYGLFGIVKTKTAVNVVEPIGFTTNANFDGHTLGFGTTVAGGFQGFIIIGDFNFTWTHLGGIQGAVFSKNISLRPGMNLRLKRPDRSIAFWVGTNGFFVNRTTNGSVNLSELKGDAAKSDLESISNESAAWYQPLSQGQKDALKDMANYKLGEINGNPKPDVIVHYSLIKNPVSNWSMAVGGQYQFNHNWQVRVEGGFLGGRKSLLISGNYRFRW